MVSLRKPNAEAVVSRPWTSRASYPGQTELADYRNEVSMTMPRDGQTVHLMSWRDVIRVRWHMHRKDGRNIAELGFYTTDDLRRLYQGTKGDIIPLRDGIVSRIQLAAEIRWRVLWARFRDWLLLIGAVAAVIAAAEGWKWFGIN